MQQACTRALCTCLCFHSGSEPGGKSTCLIFQSKKIAPRAVTALPEADGDARFCHILAPLVMGLTSGTMLCSRGWPASRPEPPLVPSAGRRSHRAGSIQPHATAGTHSCQIWEMCLIKVPDSKTKTRTGVRWDLLEPRYPHHFWQILKYKNPHTMPRNSFKKM